ncbi:MAG: tol-pal system-associated acyl-CoA thioesterase [Gammaproteobacteria bacterium]|nr:tol-pal system-associated acyl-CoA thioesterase [Gammaproteobacteria bacterium]
MRDFIFPVRVYYEDTDVVGVVYHANYLKFMERARTEWLRALGYEQDILIHEQGMLLAVSSIAVEYKKAARFNDLLQVAVMGIKLGRVTLTFEQRITRPGDREEQEIITTGHVKVASLDAITFRPKPIPQQLRQDLESAS